MNKTTIKLITDEGALQSVTIDDSGEFAIDGNPLPYAKADSVIVNTYTVPVPLPVTNGFQGYAPGKINYAISVDGKPFVVLGFSVSSDDRKGIRVAYIGFDGPVQIGVTPNE